MFEYTLTVWRNAGSWEMEEEMVKRGYCFLVCQKGKVVMWSFKYRDELEKVRDEAKRRALVVHGWNEEAA